MKGMVFTEFLEMVEARFSPEMADTIIEKSGASGAYTSVGTYHHTELVGMVLQLSEETKAPVPTLLHAFGEHLAVRFAALYPQFFASQPELFGFLASIDGHIHVEVRKLYPDAELPKFDVVERDADGIVLHYASSRHLADLAAGLIEGSARHYNTPVQVECVDAAEGGSLFKVRRISHAGTH
jgi:Haem-NO-binding